MLEQLTARELEVAALVADGCANRAIAERLTVEVSTVETHVHHILAKLQARSRTDIAVWFLRGGTNSMVPWMVAARRVSSMGGMSTGGMR